MSDIKKCFAADIGATFSRLAIINENGKILRSQKIQTPQENTVKTIHEEIKKFLGDEKVLGFAFSVAGPVKDGVAKFTNIPGNPTISAEDFSDLSQKTIILNDMPPAVYAEYSKDPHKNMVFITISTGANGCPIVDDKIIFFESAEEEIGHIKIEDEKYELPCGCGGKNHWEAFCSGLNLVRFFTEWLKVENIEADFPVTDAKSIFEAAKNGSNAANKFLDEGFNRINRIAIEKVIKKYHPEKIVFGGSVAIKNPQEILEGLEEIKNLPEISFTRYGDDVSLVGTARYLLNQGVK